MLISATPYSADSKDLGSAYNEFMSRMHSEDWACLLDHDAMWTTTIWARQIAEAIKENSDAGLFVASTNRIGCGWMKAKGVSPKEHDMIFHREFGRKLADEHKHSVVDVTCWEDHPSGKPLSGVMMCISCRTWAAVNGFKRGFLTVDNDMHKRIRDHGLKVYLLPGVYVYHWYRFQGRGS